MKNREIKQKIIDACLFLQENNLVVGTWGNLSVRVEDGIILTPSRIPYDVMKVEDMVTIDYEGNVIDGFRSPTAEREVHRLIYIARPDVNAVVHFHPEYASAMCATGSTIPPILEEITQLIGGEIPITPEYVRCGEHLKLGEYAAKYLGDKNAVLLRNHAPVCCGADLEEALTCCQVVEKAAKCYLHLINNFDIKVIPDELVKVERDRFKNDYGHEW